MKMKHLIAFAACAAALFSFASCAKNDTMATVEFAERIYSVNIGGSVEVTAVIDKALESSITVPAVFSGSAAKGTAYTVSAESFIFEAGSTRASISVTDKGMGAEDQIVIKLGGSDATVGTNSTCVVNLNANEKLIYNFSTSSIELVESSSVTVSFEGVESGKAYKAPADVVIPVAIDGDAEKFIDYPATVTLAKGTSTATIELKALPAAKDDKENLLAEQAVNPTGVLSLGGPDVLAGNTGEVAVKLLSSLLVPENLVGKWVFDRVYDIEELELWFMEMEDDPELLPTHNEGFELEFYIDEADGQVKLKTSGDGDFANYFRDGATVSMTTPLNPCSGATPAGKYAMMESNMFMAEELGCEEVLWFYYKLNPVNRAFSAEDESLGESVIAFRINDDGDLEMMFHDYDMPPFGEMWWDDEFDPDMFGFCCVLSKGDVH